MTNYDDLREKSIEELLNQVQALASVASQSQVQSIAALGARLTIELTQGIATLADAVFTAKRQLVDRMDALTGEIQSLQKQMATASEEASWHTAALVRWTKVLAVLTGVYTFITGGILALTFFARS